MTPMPSLRDPETLHPLLQTLWVAFMSRVRGAGLNPVLTFAWRSKLAQDRLYQIGRRGIPGALLIMLVIGLALVAGREGLSLWSKAAAPVLPTVTK